MDTQNAVKEQGIRARLAALARRRERAEGYLQYAILSTVVLMAGAAVLAFGQTIMQVFTRLGQSLLGFGG